MGESDGKNGSGGPVGLHGMGRRVGGQDSRTNGAY
jgi:hypothetical protein